MRVWGLGFRVEGQGYYKGSFEDSFKASRVQGVAEEGEGLAVHD